jgi:hypothetical protein
VSCILAFYLAPAATLWAAPPALTQTAVAAAANPDELYAARLDIAKARQAADLWQQQSADGRNYEASWKLAKACYYLATQGPKKDQDSQLDRGIAAGKQAAALDANRPEGHFWYAANMGEKAQRVNFFSAGKYKTPIRTELERVIAIEPGWQGGSAESALGEWYLKVPGIAGGDDTKGIELLRKALTYSAESSQIRYSLAEALSDDRKTRDEAIKLCQAVIAAPIDPEWAAEDQGFKVKARTLLDKLSNKK